MRVSKERDIVALFPLQKEHKEDGLERLLRLVSQSVSHMRDKDENLCTKARRRK